MLAAARCWQSDTTAWIPVRKRSGAWGLCLIVWCLCVWFSVFFMFNWETSMFTDFRISPFKYNICCFYATVIKYFLNVCLALLLLSFERSLKVFILGMFKLSLNILSVSQLIILEGRIKHCDYFRSGWKRLMFWIVRIPAC